MNKETLDFFNHLISDRKETMVLKSRQIGKSESLTNWRKSFEKYNRAQNRKETIKRLFNI